jgi:transcriptional regulator with XRE-family HTH domain
MKLGLENEQSFIRDYRLKIGDALRRVRENKGYSQDELAEMMNLNCSTISKIENGKFNLSLDYLSKFSLFLDFEFQLKETNNNKSGT